MEIAVKKFIFLNIGMVKVMSLDFIIQTFDTTVMATLFHKIINI